MKDNIIRAILVFIFFTVVCGVIYPSVITVVSRHFF